MGNKNLDQIRKETIQKRDEQLIRFLPHFEQIIRTANISAERVEEITRMDLSDMVRMLNKRTITSEILVAIFGFRAGTIGKQLCIITEDYFEYALKKAKQCDEYREKSGKYNWTFDEEWDPQRHLWPLYGIPISIKDNLDMVGTRTTFGLTCRSNTFLDEDCSLIKCIKNSGMIPFIKTNLPQLAFTFDSNNFLWGRCLNPWNQTKTAGGSSGGEGAAVAARISPIGIGNDMAGSIRIPSHCCGIAGLMTSPRRLPAMGNLGFLSTGFLGKDLFTPVNGPMARSIDALAMWTHLATTQELYKGENDPYIKLIPFDFKEYKEYQRPSNKLKIGYIENLDFIECTPACLRAIKQTTDFLRKQGHELIQVEIPNEREIIQGLVTQIACEGNLRTFKDAMEKEPTVPEYKRNQLGTSLPRWLQNIIQFVLRSIRPRLATFLQGSKTRTTYEYFTKAGRVYELRKQFIDYWRKLNLDFIILPGFATEAPNHGSSKDGSAFAAYTFIWNVLAMTGCTVPVTVVKEEEQYYESRWADEITQLLKTSTENSAGLPVGIQVIGLPFCEQKVLGLSKQIEQHFKFQEKHPYPQL